MVGAPIGRGPDPIGRPTALASGLPRADEIDAEVPRAFADVVSKALEVDINNRFQSAEEMESALEGVERELEARKRTGVAGVVEAILHRRLWQVTAAVAITPLILATLGMVSTAAFNLTLDRPARFATESPRISYGAIARTSASSVTVLLGTIVVAS